RARGGETQKQAQAWIREELENVQAAVAWSEENEPDLFDIAVGAFEIYLRQTGRFSEELRLSEELHRRCDMSSDPQSWARMQTNLGNAYQGLPTGDLAQNLAKAIAYYMEALRFYTERDYPKEWATTQNNLGVAYWSLPTGNREENFAQA